MGWYPCTCCAECCKDLSTGCGCICVGKNPCDTTLTITGNHPATLKFPISYTRNPSSLPPQPDYCGIEGCSPVNRATSTGHTFVRNWEEKERLWDKIKADCYTCCLEFGGGETPYLSSRIEGNGVYVASRCYKSAIRYMNLEVSIRQGKQAINGVDTCGVYVFAKLTFERYFQYLENVCEYRYGKIIYYEVPCISYPGGVPPPLERACSRCLPGGGAYTPSGNYSTEPYPTMPTCPEPTWSGDNPDEEPLVPNNIRCLERFKFIPNVDSVSCKQQPFTVSLGPENNLGISPGTQIDCCGKNRDYPEDSVYYDYAELYNPECSSWSNCKGTFPARTAYGTWISGGVFPGFGLLSEASIGNCTTNNQLSIGSCDPCEITERDRGQEIIRPLPNHTLLFGEASDQWTLSILCSG